MALARAEREDARLTDFWQLLEPLAPASFFSSSIMPASLTLSLSLSDSKSDEEQSMLESTSEMTSSSIVLCLRIGLSSVNSI